MLATPHAAAPRAIPHDDVASPSHYRGAGLEAIEVIDDWIADPAAHLGTAIKYLCRSGRKTGQPAERCLGKARWYIARARSMIADGHECGTWGRDTVPAIDARRVVVAFELTPELAVALGCIGHALAGPTFADHWLALSLSVLDQEIGACLAAAE